MGACALGPLITADDEYFGNMTVSKADGILRKLKGQEGNGDGREDES
jgi:NADH:ubiquinone oxidoreductase subunit E